MASYAYTFTSGDTVTPTKLNDARTVSDIVNADISATAAIAGTKIAPNFGSQNVATTGTLAAGAITASTVTLNTGANPLFVSNSGAPYIEVRDTNATTRTFLQAANGIGAVGTISDHPFRVNTNNTERLRVLASGNVGIGSTSANYLLDVNGTVNTTDAYRVDGTKVVGNRATGWAAATGTATRTTFATSTVTTAELAERVKALIDDLTTHGLIGT